VIRLLLSGKLHDALIGSYRCLWRLRARFKFLSFSRYQSVYEAISRTLKTKRLKNENSGNAAVDDSDRNFFLFHSRDYYKLPLGICFIKLQSIRYASLEAVFLLIGVLF